MIRQRIYLPEYRWTVYAYYAVSCYYADEIMEHLYDIDVEPKFAKQAEENLTSGKLDTGLTYSNYRRRKSVMVIALTSSAAEFFNSLDHEKKHVEAHITQARRLDPYGEKTAYLSGELAMAMFPKVKHLMCDCCRNKLIEK